MPLAILAGIAAAHLKHHKSAQVILALIIAGLVWQNGAIPRPFRADYQTMAAQIREDHSQKVVLAFKDFNGLGVKYALGFPSDLVVLQGFDEVCRATVNGITAGKAVWVVFNQWAKTVAFEHYMDSAGVEWKKLEEQKAMPPLSVYRASASPSNLAVEGPAK